MVKGTAGGWAGSYDFIANGAAAVAALRALVDYEGLVLVETAFGDTFYCSLTGMTVKRQGTPPAPRLAGTLTFAQVDCDLATETLSACGRRDRPRRPGHAAGRKRFLLPAPPRWPAPPWASLHVVAGQVTADCRRAATRDATVTFAPGPGQTYDSLYALLATPGLELSLARGFVLADGSQVTAPLGVFVIDELTYKRVGAASGWELTAACTDRSQRITRARWTQPYQIAAGTALADAINAAVLDRWPGAQTIVSAATMPNSLGAQAVFDAGAGLRPLVGHLLAGDLVRLPALVQHRRRAAGAGRHAARQPGRRLHLRAAARRRS